MRPGYFSCLTITLLLLTSLVQAEGFYLDMGLGGSYMMTPDMESELDARVQRVQQQNGTATYGIDRMDVGGNYHFGYQMNAFWGVELGYAYLGDVRMAYDAVVTGIYGTARYYQRETLSTTLVSLSASGFLPLSERLDLIGKLGVARWRIREKDVRYCEHTNPENTVCGAYVTGNRHRKYLGNSPSVALGLRYGLTEALGFKAVWDYYSGIGNAGQTGSMDGSLFTLGLDYRFFAAPVLATQPVFQESGKPYLGLGVTANTLQDFGWAAGYQLFAGYELPVSSSPYSLGLEMGFAATQTMAATQGDGETEAHGGWAAIFTSMTLIPQWHGQLRIGGDFGNDPGLLTGVGLNYDLTRDYRVQMTYSQRSHLQSIALNFIYLLGDDTFAWHKSL